MKVAFFQDHNNEVLNAWNTTDICDAMNSSGIHSSKIFNPGSNLNELANYDTVIFYRCVGLYEKLISQIKLYGIPVGYSVDDYIWEPNDAYYNHLEASVIKTYFNLADYFVFMSHYHSTKLKTNNPIIIRKPTIAKKMFDVLSSGSKIPRRNEYFSICLTKGHITNDITVFISGVLAMLNKMNLSKKIIFHHFGNHDYLSSQSVNVIKNAYFNSVSDFHGRLANMGIDLIINPLQESEFNNCKCYPKYLEAGSLSVPLLASRVVPFVKVITDYKNGLLASSIEEYAYKIAWAIHHPEEMKNISEAALTDILKNHITENHYSDFIRDLKSTVVKDKIVASPTVLNSVPELFSPPAAKKIEPIPSKLKDNKDKDPMPGFYEDTGSISVPVTHTGYLDQLFFFTGNELSKIEVKGATYNETLQYSPRFEIYSGTSLIISGHMRFDTLKDNGWWALDFPAFIPMNRNITVRIQNMDKKPISFYLASNRLGQSCTIHRNQTSPIAMKIY